MNYVHSDSGNKSSKSEADLENKDPYFSMDYPFEIVNYLDEETPVSFGTSR